MSTFHGQTVDIWEDWEGALLGSLTLDSADGHLNDHDATKPYAGTYSASLSLTSSNTISRVYYGSQTLDSPFSLGFWYWSGTFAAWSGVYEVIRFLYASSGYQRSLVAGASNNNSTPNQIATYNDDGSARVVLSANTWYWVTMQWNKGSTCKCRVYNTSHAQVGSEFTWTALNETVQSIAIGNCGGASAASWATSVYFDDWVIDKTNALYPILGWDVAGGGSVGGAILARFRRNHHEDRRMKIYNTLPWALRRR